MGLDVARCVALLGMIVTHVLPAADEDGVTVAQQIAGADLHWHVSRGALRQPGVMDRLEQTFTGTGRLALLLGRSIPALAAVLFGAGAMTLSLYSAHVVLRTPEFLPADDVPTFAAHVLIVMTVGAAYRLARRSGPLERLVSTSANGTRAAVRRRFSASASAS